MNHTLPTHPQLHWQENGQSRQARWRSEGGNPVPETVQVADDTLTANAAHRLVREHRAKVEADLKATLMAYDEGKRNGASREKLNKLQERIRADLDLVSTLSRAEQN